MGSIWIPRTSSIIVTLASIFIDSRTGKITRPTTCIPVPGIETHMHMRLCSVDNQFGSERTLFILMLAWFARGFRLQIRDAHGSGWVERRAPEGRQRPFYHLRTSIKGKRMPRFYSVRSLWFEHARESSWDRRVIFKITACRFIARDLGASFNNIASRLGMATLFMVECLVFRSLSRTAV